MPTKKTTKNKKEDKIKALIEEIISSIIGKSGEEISSILYKKKNVNEFLISKKLNMTINQTRNLLYRLSDHGLIHFIRKKDSKKGGWYTYFWTLNTKKSLELLLEQISNKIKKLEEEFQKKKSERFYFSPGAGLEYNEEEALEHNFICPETGEVMQLKDNKSSISDLDIGLSKFRLLLNEVSLELQELNKKKEIEIGKRLKQEEKEKEKEKKARREKLRRKKRREQKAKEKPKKKSSAKKIKRK